MSKQFNTVTGTLEPTSETGVSVASLMDAAGGFENVPRRLESGEFKNTGTTNLSIACLQDRHPGNPLTAQYKTIEPNDVFVFDRIHLEYTFVRTADDAGDNALQFAGTPVEQ